MNAKKVCVIGAGACGLAALKECLAENLDAVCYEKSSSVGGLWRYREDDDPNMPSVMRSTIINTSKELSAFSDFPPPEDFPNYMHNSKMVRYFELYAERNNLYQHIKYSHQVIDVSREETGRWRVKVRDLTLNKESEDTFDGVMICTGHHAQPSVPYFPGQEKFKGTITHSHSYKKPVNMEGTTAVVVGVGNSGGDVTVELSSICDKVIIGSRGFRGLGGGFVRDECILLSISIKVYLSTKRGVWVMNRVGEDGIPVDVNLGTRAVVALVSFLPYNWKCCLLENRLNSRFDHKAYNLKPAHRALSQHVMINDALPNRILSGTVAVKSNIRVFTENGVIFEGEEEETPCDVVILATGYRFTFPFVGDDLIKVERNQTDLYKFMFPPHLEQPHTLACIGLVQPLGAIFPIAEMQSRWFVQLLQGKRKLPSVEQMMDDIRRTRQQLKEQFIEGERHTIEVDWLQYMDMIALEVGVKPNLLKYFFTDFDFWKHLFFGPYVPYQYRLEGPHRWAGAKEAIMGTMDRVKAPLITKSTFKHEVEPQTPSLVFQFFVKFFFLFSAYVLYFYVY